MAWLGRWRPVVNGTAWAFYHLNRPAKDMVGSILPGAILASYVRESTGNIYWTAAGWNPGAGITDANNFCNTHHPAGASGTFVAIVVSKFLRAGPYQDRTIIVLPAQNRNQATIAASCLPRVWCSTGAV